MTIQQLVDGLLGQLGLLVALIFILYAGYKRWWVFGWYAKELRDDKERLENRLDRSIGATSTVTGLAHKATEAALERKVEATSD